MKTKLNTCLFPDFSSRFLALFLFLVLGSWFLAPFSFAKPERLEIKEASHRMNEKAAKAQIKNINLKNIEDPEARKAIQQIFNYLNLQSQK